MRKPSRQEVARVAWEASGDRSNEGLSNSLLGDILGLAIADFVSIYKCARGHQIDPLYVTGLRHDILIAIEAAAKADASRLPSPTPGDEDV